MTPLYHLMIFHVSHLFSFHFYIYHSQMLGFNFSPCTGHRDIDNTIRSVLSASCPNSTQFRSKCGTLSLSKTPVIYIHCFSQNKELAFENNLSDVLAKHLTPVRFLLKIHIQDLLTCTENSKIHFYNQNI